MPAPRDFLAPVAAYEDVSGPFSLVAKFQGNLWAAEMKHSPLNVVAWHGNFAPYKYDLGTFQRHRLGELRSSRSVDFYPPDRALGSARHRDGRLRTFPTALAWGEETFGSGDGSTATS